jgi:hypothetical protein
MSNRAAMPPLLRAWAFIAIAFALLLALRGALAAALAVLLLSPAPLLAWRSTDGAATRPLAWLAIVFGTMLLLIAALLAIVAAGGLPQVHEWRALLRD